MGAPSNDAPEELPVVRDESRASSAQIQNTRWRWMIGLGTLSLITLVVVVLVLASVL